MPNESITWLTMTSYNLGIDARFLDGLVGFEFDVFYRKTRITSYNVCYTKLLRPSLAVGGPVGFVIHPETRAKHQQDGDG